MFFSYLSLAFLLALEAAAGPVRKAAFAEHGWQRKFIAPRDGRIKLHIALRQSDGGAEVERQLFDVSDPKSASFRRHLSPDQAASVSPPAHGSVHAVEFWLRQYRLLNDASLFGGIFEIDTTIRSAERVTNSWQNPNVSETFADPFALLFAATEHDLVHLVGWRAGHCEDGAFLPPGQRWGPHRLRYTHDIVSAAEITQSLSAASKTRRHSSPRSTGCSARGTR